MGLKLGAGVALGTIIGSLLGYYTVGNTGAGLILGVVAGALLGGMWAVIWSRKP
jgi:hypothetical protein